MLGAIDIGILPFLVYRQDAIDLCSHPPGSLQANSRSSTVDPSDVPTMPKLWLTSLLILVPLRLGLNELDLIYEPYLKEALKLPQTVGIIGGSPRHAVYIVGFQDDSFIDFDPHFSQTSVNVLDDTFDLSVSKRTRQDSSTLFVFVDLFLFIAQEVNGKKDGSQLCLGILLQR